MQETEPLQDRELLRSFARDGSTSAFETLVHRHTDWVFASAYRQLRDRQLAEDATQAVFLLLCQKAAAMKDEQRISGWLFRAVRYIAGELNRSRIRQMKHEQQAAMRQAEAVDSLNQIDLAADLDGAVAKLSETDRELVLLRFYQSMEFEQAAQAMRISEPAARKRLTRAIGRLRVMLSPNISAENLGAIALVGHGMASADLPHMIARMAIAGGTVSGAATGFQRSLWFIKLKIAAAILIVGSAVVVIPLLPKHSRHLPQAVRLVAQQTPAPIPPSVVSGFQAHCADAAGKPVADAQVYLVQSIYSSRDQDEPPHITLGPIATDGAGIAKFDHVPAVAATDLGLTRTIYARIPGRLVGFGTQQWDRRERGEVPSNFTEIRLGASVTLLGMIKMPAGFKPESAAIKTSSIDLSSAPLSGETLWRYATDTKNFLAETYDVRGNADGTYSIADIPASSTSYLIANAPGLAETQLRTLATAPAASLVFDMLPESIIRGHVTLPDGKPAANVTIQARPLGSSFLVFNTDFAAKTDADGQYSIHRLPGVTVGLHLETGNNQFALPVKTIRLMTAQTVDQDLKLQTGTLVTGRVVDQAGKPLAHAGIGAESVLDGGVMLGSEITDASGQFTLRLPEGPCMIYVSAPPDGFALPKKGREQTITVPADTATMKGPTWTLPYDKPGLPYATATLQGRIVDEKGHGLPNLTVVEDWGGQPMQLQDSRAATTDADGRYTLKVQANIQHTVSQSSPDFDRPKSVSMTPIADEVMTVDDLVVHATPIRSTVTGIIVDPKGRPVGDVTIAGQPDQRSTDASGRFELPIRTTTPFITFMVAKAGYRYRGWTDIPSDAKDVRLTMIPTTDKPLDYSAKSKAPEPQTLLDAIAPAMHVDWVLLPQRDPPTLSRTDGRSTVIIFDSDSREPEEIQRTLTDLQNICVRGNAVPIAIFNPNATDAGIRARFTDRAKTMNIGIDQYLADSNPNDIDGTTAMAYGAKRRGTQVYLIAPDGTLIHTQTGMKGLESHLAN